MLELDEKSEILSFFYSFKCEAQRVIEKARRGAKRSTDLTPSPFLHFTPASIINRVRTCSRAWLASLRFVQYQSAEIDKRDQNGSSIERNDSLIIIPFLALCQRTGRVLKVPMCAVVMRTRDSMQTSTERTSWWTSSPELWREEKRTRGTRRPAAAVQQLDLGVDAAR